MVTSLPGTAQPSARKPVRRRFRLPLETTFLLVSFVFGTVFIFVTPPFQVADESRHFSRAYQLSEEALSGVGLIARPEALPASLVRAIEQTEYLLNETGPRFTTDQFSTLVRAPLQPAERAHFGGTASYTFVAYLPQILLITPLRLAEVNAVITLYAARLAALLFWMLLTYWAIRLVPIGKPLLFFITLLPMTLFQAASLSADSVTFALSFLLVAQYLRLAYRPGGVDTRDAVTTAGIAVALTAAKFVYAPLIGLHFLIPRSKFTSPAVYAGGFLLTAGLCLLILAPPFNSLFSLVSSMFAPPESTNVVADLTPYPQVNFLLADPENVVQTFGATLARFGRSYLNGFVGILGWYGASLPSYLYIVTVILLWLTALTTTDRFRVPPAHKMGLLAIVMIVTAAICVGISTDLRENPVPTVQMRGIQGRYFTPVSPLIGLLVTNRVPFFRRYRPFVKRAILPFLVFLLVNAVYCLLMRYYV